MTAMQHCCFAGCTLVTCGSCSKTLCINFQMHECVPTPSDPVTGVWHGVQVTYCSTCKAYACPTHFPAEFAAAVKVAPNDQDHS